MWYGNSHNTFLGIPGVPGLEEEQKKNKHGRWREFWGRSDSPGVGWSLGPHFNSWHHHKSNWSSWGRPESQLGKGPSPVLPIYASKQGAG